MNKPMRHPNKTNPEGYSPKIPKIAGMMEIQNQQQANRTENILLDISYIGYDGGPSAVCYLGSIMRLMDYLKDSINDSELSVLSGIALCFPWKAGYTCDEVSILSEIPQRTFNALGYENEYIYESDILLNPRKYTKEFYIEKIRHSIDNGRPVIGFGFTHLNFTCLITGYYDNGEGLYLRSYWKPEGTPDGYDKNKYYYTKDWYEKCHGILVVGNKIRERLSAKDAYDYLKESAKIFKEKKTSLAQWDKDPITINQGSAAFDDMAHWVLDDNWWIEGCHMGYRDLLLKPCGLLLLDHYRSHLYFYLEKLFESYPELVNPKIIPAIEALGSYITGPNVDINNLSTLDPDITDFSKLHERSAREKVAELVMNLKELDKKIFDSILD